MKKNTNKLERIVIILLFFLIIAIVSYFYLGIENEIGNTINNNKISYEISNVPEYNGQAYVKINNDNPNFTTEEMNLKEDYYSTLKGGKVRDGYDKNLLGKSK